MGQPSEAAIRLPDGARVLRGAAPIDGVKVIPLRRVPDERGTIFHMLRESDAHFERFGEIYFSTVYKGVIKGWHQHQDMSLNYACMVGRVKCALYDDREGSSSKGSLMEVFLGPDSYSLLIVPPGGVYLRALETSSLVTRASAVTWRPMRRTSSHT